MVSNVQVDYQPGDANCNGHFEVHADTHLGEFDYNRELPMELQMDDGLELTCTLGGVELEASDEELPDFDPPPHEGRGADLFAEKAEGIVAEVLEKWLATRQSA